MSDSELTMGAAGHGALMEETPYGMQSKKLAMWLFIASDAVTFTVALVAYGFLRIGSPDWTRPFYFWPSIANGLVMTFVLLSSSLTMLVAVRAAKAGDKHKSIQWIGFTILLGIIFAGLHLREWFHMFADGWGLFRNPDRRLDRLWRCVLQRYRASPAARHFRRDSTCRDRMGLQPRPAGCEPRRDHQPVLALR